MRLFESTPLKLLLIPLVPVAAIGIVTLAASVEPSRTTQVTHEIRCAPAPQPPPPAPPPRCTDCRAPAPA